MFARHTIKPGTPGHRATGHGTVEHWTEHQNTNTGGTPEHWQNNRTLTEQSEYHRIAEQEKQHWNNRTTKQQEILPMQNDSILGN